MVRRPVGDGAEGVSAYRVCRAVAIWGVAAAAAAVAGCTDPVPRTDLPYFTYAVDPDNGPPPLTVTFSFRSSDRYRLYFTQALLYPRFTRYPEESRAVEGRWEGEFSHTYDLPGIYRPRLAELEPGKFGDEEIDYIVYVGSFPHYEWTASPTTGNAPLRVVFRTVDHPRLGQDENGKGFIIDFGKGTSEGSHGEVDVVDPYDFPHIYRASGVYIAELTSVLYRTTVEGASRLYSLSPPIIITVTDPNATEEPPPPGPLPLVATPPVVAPGMATRITVVETAPSSLSPRQAEGLVYAWSALDGSIARVGAPTAAVWTAPDEDGAYEVTAYEYDPTQRAILRQGTIALTVSGETNDVGITVD